MVQTNRLSRNNLIGYCEVDLLEFLSQVSCSWDWENICNKWHYICHVYVVNHGLIICNITVQVLGLLVCKYHPFFNLQYDKLANSPTIVFFDLTITCCFLCFGRRTICCFYCSCLHYFLYGFFTTEGLLETTALLSQGRGKGCVYTLDVLLLLDTMEFVFSFVLL